MCWNRWKLKTTSAEYSILKRHGIYIQKAYCLPVQKDGEKHELSMPKVGTNFTIVLQNLKR